MSQAHVELVIGRLATDEHWRGRYRRTPDEALEALIDEAGLDVTATERRALIGLSSEALERFADTLDPRLQRMGAER